MASMLATLSRSRGTEAFHPAWISPRALAAPHLRPLQRSSHTARSWEVLKRHVIGHSCSFSRPLGRRADHFLDPIARRFQGRRCSACRKGLAGRQPAARSEGRCCALLCECTSRPVNLHYHSGSLLSQASNGSSVPMHVECSVVSIDFVQKHFCIIFARHQDFELQRSRFILQATGSMRHQQG